MASYTINLYSSDSLYNYCQNEHGDGLRAVDRAETFFEGAFNQHSQHSATVTAISGSIPAPTENYHESPGYYATPCEFSQYFEYLDEWFYNWRTCNSTAPSADVHLLLTNTENISGGVADYDHGHCVAITGRYISELPYYYEEWGDSYAFNGMSTALHEFAHYAMGNVSESHERGDDVYRQSDGQWNTTPMLDLNVDTDGENACNQPLSVSSAEGYEMWWDDCCRGSW